MKKEIIGLLGMILVLTSFVSADMGNEGCFGGMGGMMMGSYGYGGMFYGWAFGLLTLVALILLVIWLIKQIQKK